MSVTIQLTCANWDARVTDPKEKISLHVEGDPIGLAYLIVRMMDKIPYMKTVVRSALRAVDEADSNSGIKEPGLDALRKTAKEFAEELDVLRKKHGLKEMMFVASTGKDMVPGYCGLSNISNSVVKVILDMALKIVQETSDAPGPISMHTKTSSTEWKDKNIPNAKDN